MQHPSAAPLPFFLSLSCQATAQLQIKGISPALQGHHPGDKLSPLLAGTATTPRARLSVRPQLKACLPCLLCVLGQVREDFCVSSVQGSE